MSEQGPSLEGFYDFKLGQVSDFPRALRAGMMLDQPVIAAKYRMPAPHPDVQLVLPIDRRAAQAWKRGDKTVPTVLGAELLSAITRVLRNLKGGLTPDGQAE